MNYFTEYWYVWIIFAIMCVFLFSFYGKKFKQLKEKKIKKLLLIATGALMNSTSSQQGESIPGIAHAISIEM